ncbi:MAG: iron-sulfur cluster assembly accessory protein [Candidatus Cloacimonetes bacterium]|nr:iron-sulfur cluster assembly accessory protein [Candidatus Cloacimonadota bacterium]
MSVELTEKAVKQLHQILEKSGKSESKLKLGVRNGGCAGMSYTMDIVKEVTDQFLNIDCQGIPVVMESDHAQYLKGLVLDYNDDILNSGFRWHNPNATETCGCGSSFSTKKPA